MMDAIDGNEVARIPVGEAFRRRFNNPYAVIHRADIHQSVYEEVQLAPDIAVHTAARIVRVDVEAQGVRLQDAGTVASTKARPWWAATASIRSCANG